MTWDVFRYQAKRKNSGSKLLGSYCLRGWGREGGIATHEDFLLSAFIQQLIFSAAVRYLKSGQETRLTVSQEPGNETNCHRPSIQARPMCMFQI